MRRLRSTLQTIRAFLLQDARATLRDAPAVWNALTSHVALTIFGLLLLIAAFLTVGLLFWPFLQHTMRPSNFDERKEVVVLLVQGLAVLGGAAALVFTWLRLRAAERTIQISQEGQITERFTRAIQQLGDLKMEVRLGGIYALERIARDSPRDHWTIMEVLTTFVRENSRSLAQTASQPATLTLAGDYAPPLPAITYRTDTQAIFTVLGRRPEKARKEERKENHILDLRGTYLRGANLRDAYLEGANLWGAILWDDAHLEGAHLRAAHMEYAYLRDAHMEGADLRDAHMERARLRDAHMEGADLRGAHMEGADLGNTIGLTREQLDSAITDKDTILPDYLRNQGSAPPSP